MSEYSSNADRALLKAGMINNL